MTNISDLDDEEVEDIISILESGEEKIPKKKSYIEPQKKIVHENNLNFFLTFLKLFVVIFVGCLFFNSVTSLSIIENNFACLLDGKGHHGLISSLTRAFLTTGFVLFFYYFAIQK
jgi:hypothetical protein